MYKMMLIFHFAVMLLVLISVVLKNVECRISKDMYDQMPALYKFHDYDECLTENDIGEPAVFCYVKSLIKPDDNSQLWHFIEDISKSDKLHFHHEELHRGLCLKSCRQLLGNTTEDTRELLYQKNFNPDRRITLTVESFPNTLEYRQLYDRIMNECVNLELRSEYNLTAYSEVEYCVTYEDTPKKFHFLDKLFFFLVGLLFILLGLCTAYDMKLKREYNRPNHYATSLPDKLTTFYCTFSIPRNWSCLAGEERSELSKDLRFIHCQRFLMTSWFVFLHCALMFFVVAIDNPRVAEENFLNAFIVGIDFIRFFFVLSALLITILDIDEMENKMVVLNFRYFWKGILDRYMRFIPIYASILLVRVSPMMLNLGDGPIFDKLARLENGNCQRNWWSNLLFINNFVKLDDACTPEGWYLATDLQLFIFARLFRMIIWKNPKLTKIFLGGGIALSYLYVGWAHYHQELEGALIAPLRTVHIVKNLQITDKYEESYMHPFMHIGDVLIGIMGGILFHHLRKKNTNLKDYKGFMILWYLTVPILCCIIEYTKIFFRNDFEKPSVWMAVSATFLRHLWAWLFLWFFFGLAFRVNATVCKFYNHPIFRVLGKLSYCVYLIHFIFMALEILQSRVPLPTNLFSILKIFIYIWSSSYAVGFFICLLVELPLAGFYNNLFRDKNVSSIKQSNKDTKLN